VLERTRTVLSKLY